MALETPTASHTSHTSEIGTSLSRTSFEADAIFLSSNAGFLSPFRPRPRDSSPWPTRAPAGPPCGGDLLFEDLLAAEGLEFPALELGILGLLRRADVAESPSTLSRLPNGRLRDDRVRGHPYECRKLTLCRLPGECPKLGISEAKSGVGRCQTAFQK